MKILLAIPCMDSVAVGFASSLLGLNTDGATMIPYFMSGSLIYDARNRLGDLAVENECDYIMWFDSDMIFNQDVFQKLLADDKDIVSGIYFTRRKEVKPTFFKRVDGIRQEDGSLMPVAEHYFDYPKESLFEVDGCGFGIVLMKTKVYKDVRDKYGVPFAPILGFGEDLSFCKKAQSCGYKVWCDSRVKAGHVRHSIVGENDYLLSRSEGFEE